MSVITNVKKAVRTVTGRRGPRLLTVKKAWHLTPNLIRVTFAGRELTGIQAGCEGGNCKLLIPDIDESREDFSARVESGPNPVRRTYTVRYFREEALELDIDFVAHGDSGPASRWAENAKPGDFLGFMGPSSPKVTHFNADWYLVAADLSALPMAAATLEAMPRDARGVALFEVTSAEDKQDIDAPEGVDVQWLIHPDPHTPSSQQVNAVQQLEWPEGRVQTCIAGESGVIKSLRTFLKGNADIAREDLYLSGYWKIGLVEDEHQKEKRAEAS